MSKLQIYLTTIFCSILFCACVITPVLCFVFKPYQNTDIIPIAVDDINISTGQSTKIRYQLRVDNAEVKFSVTDESIAKISNNDKIEGISQGITFLNVDVVATSLIYSTVAQINVVEDEGNDKPDIPDEPDEDDTNLQKLCFEITTIENCEYSANQLSLKQNFACFSVNIYTDVDKKDKFNFREYQIICSDFVTVEKEINCFTITASKNGGFFMYFPELNYAVFIEVYV